MGAGIVGGLLQAHQHAEQRVAVGVPAGGGRLDADVGGADAGQALGRRARPRVRVQHELAGVGEGGAAAVELEALAGRLAQVRRQGVVPDVGEPGACGVELQGATWEVGKRI